MPLLVVLDVNETLSDTSPVTDRLAAIGAGGVTASGWLAATLRDGFALSLTTGARSFPDVARQTLTTLLTSQDGLTCSVGDGVDEVMEVFMALPVHPDVVQGVRMLQAQGHRLVALSNGTSGYARDLLGRAGVADAFEALLTVDDVGRWKPHRSTYEHALASTGTDAAGAVLVAVHPWDLHGARAAGLATAYLDRVGAPWQSVFDAPDHHVCALTELRL